MYRQKTQWAKSSKVITLLVTVLLLVVIGLTYEVSMLAFVICLLSLVAITVSALLFFPRAVEVGGGVLTVVFPVRYRSFSLTSIEKIEPYTLKGLPLVKLWGGGAYFGWWGLFNSKGIGNFILYAANLDRLVLMQLTNGKKYMISCDHPEAMVEAVGKAK